VLSAADAFISLRANGRSRDVLLITVHWTLTFFVKPSRRLRRCVRCGDFHRVSPSLSGRRRVLLLELTGLYAPQRVTSSTNLTSP